MHNNEASGKLNVIALDTSGERISSLIILVGMCRSNHFCVQKKERFSGQFKFARKCNKRKREKIRND